ncbi:MAG: hypothetical protein LBU09_04695 [Endomicrobium sp.]|jgi:hemolysin activation/secretion protein|nr:hypothetical protein [Endomicrobium sp.]
MGKNKKILVLSVIMFMNAAELFSASLSAQEDYLQRQITQQQEQEKEYRENIRNILELQRIKDSRPREEKPTEDKERAPETFADINAQEENLYNFDKIELSGNRVFSYKKLQKAVLNKFIGKPVNKENVSLLQSMLSGYYIKKGYVSAKVYFDAKQIRAVENKETKKFETVFKLIIEEGIAGGITLKSINAEGEDKSVSKIKSFRAKSRLFFAFPFLKGKAVNINKFEQGLDQMNKLQSNSVTMDILPSLSKNLTASTSDIIITNNQNSKSGGSAAGARTVFLNLNYNNGGSASTGENVINLSISQDNLLAVNDNIYVSYTENSDSLFNTDTKDKNTDYGESHNYKVLDLFGNDDEKKRFSKSLYAAFSFPFGYWSFNAGLNYSSYKTLAQGQHNLFHVTGQTIGQTYSIDTVLWRTQKYKANFASALEIKDSQSYVRDVKSETGSSRRSSVSAYLNNTLYSKFGTLIIKPSYQKGLSLFGAKSDRDVYVDSSMEKSDPRLQYDLLKLYIYFSAQFNIALPSKNKETNTRSFLPISYTLTIDSQYSFNSLYGNEQLSAGGQYTVRGFKNSVISGDSGFYIRNDFKINMLQLLPNSIPLKESMKRQRIIFFGDSINQILSKTHFTAFYDFGYVANRYETVYDKQYDSQRANMSGMGISVSYYGKYANMSLTYSKALHNPKYLQERDGIEKEEDAIYWKIGASW